MVRSSLIFTISIAFFSTYVLTSLVLNGDIKSSLGCYLLNNNIFKSDYHVEYNPYDYVNWKNDFKCLSQHHDHINVSESNLRAYDKAGYCAVPIFNYSGTKKIKGAWNALNWPLSRYLDHYDTDEDFLESTNNIKILFRAVEEVGSQHIISNFMGTYIESRGAEKNKPLEESQYDSPQAAIDLINYNGGLAFIAHPWTWDEKKIFKELKDYSAVEIFTAFS